MICESKLKNKTIIIHINYLYYLIYYLYIIIINIISLFITISNPINFYLLTCFLLLAFHLDIILEAISFNLLITYIMQLIKQEFIYLKLFY
jgi:hypothetical protein